MNSDIKLRQMLGQINRKSYPAYKSIAGRYDFKDYILSIDHVQSDPFASPSAISIIVSGKTAGFPNEYYDTEYKKTALEDFLIRSFANVVKNYSFKAKGSGKSGLLSVVKCGQEIIKRSACDINTNDGSVTFRMQAGFPANGRTINSPELEEMLFEFLPKCIYKALQYKNADVKSLKQCIELAQDQYFIRQELDKCGLVAFVANDSILPRKSGISDYPLKDAVRFKSPESMQITMNLPNRGQISGMGIKKGITLIVGGGYHGKSTLLKALQMGVYNHIAGDGREYVITDNTAFKIRAEDGRGINNVNISMFINDLPNEKDTRKFSSDDASGSTSEAANVSEAIEAGSRLLLIDEDTSATNFMIRDELMQLVVSSDSEPITPFIDRVRNIADNMGISTILVAGSSGEYFYKADCIIQMNRYEVYDVTERAKKVAAEYAQGYIGVTYNNEDNNEEKNSVYARSNLQTSTCISRKGTDVQAGVCMQEAADTQGTANIHDTQVNEIHNMNDVHNTSDIHDMRHPSFRPGGGKNGRVKIKTNGTDAIIIDREEINLRYVEQLMDCAQLETLGIIMCFAAEHVFDGKKTLSEAVEMIWARLRLEGFAGVCRTGMIPSNLAMPRKQDIFACINRWRGVRM